MNNRNKNITLSTLPTYDPDNLNPMSPPGEYLREMRREHSKVPWWLQSIQVNIKKLWQYLHHKIDRCDLTNSTFCNNPNVPLSAAAGADLQMQILALRERTIVYTEPDDNTFVVPVDGE